MIKRGEVCFFTFETFWGRGLNFGKGECLTLVLLLGWVGALKLTMKGLSSSGRSMGGRRSDSGGKIPLEGPSVGFCFEPTY